MKHFYLFILCCLLAINLNAQLFVSDTSDYKYFVAESEPDPGWKNLNFNDDNWNDGCSTIGFGYPDSIIINPINSGSLLLRYPFEVSDIDAITEMVLMSDFDDAFVAYINGVEVARVNLGRKGENITFNRLSDRSKESFFLNKYTAPVPGLALDLNTVKSALVPGKNILSVQVHNDSIGGSDLTYLAFLYNFPPSMYSMYNYNARFYQQLELQSSKFPIVHINTDEFYLPRKHVRYMSNVKIINNKNSENKPTDIPTDYDSYGHIERRGESSSDFAKFSFNFESVDKDTNSIDTAIMDMPRDNDWVLMANYTDKSLIRNKICFELVQGMGHYVPRSRFCELIYNGEYQGLYLFVEKIKRGKNRVYVAKKPETPNFSPDQIGYIFKFDKPNATLQFIYPNKDNITEEQKNYIANYFKDFYNVLKTPDFNHAELGYKKYIVPSSLIDFVVINELTKNADAYLYSTYMYKEGYGKRVKYGPIWDNDLSFGNTIFQSGNLIEGWQFKVNTNLRISLIMNDLEFSTAFSNRWNELRQGVLKTENIFKIVDSLANLIEDSRIRNYTVWHTIDKQIFWPGYDVDTYEDEIAQLKSYIEKRALWIDSNIEALKTSIGKTTYARISTSVYPNPCTDKLNLKVAADSGGEYLVQVTDLNGRTVIQESFYSNADETRTITFQSADITRLKGGIYFIKISKDGNVIGSNKFVKM